MRKLFQSGWCPCLCQGLQCERVGNLDTEGSALMQRLESIMAEKVLSPVVSESCGNLVDVCDGSGVASRVEEAADDGVPEEEELSEEEEEGDSEEDLSDEELVGDDEFGGGEDGSE